MAKRLKKKSLSSARQSANRRRGQPLRPYRAGMVPDSRDVELEERARKTKPRTQQKPALIGIDSWAFSLAKKLADEYGLRASEIYSFLTESKKIESSLTVIEELAIELCDGAPALGKSFAETRKLFAKKDA